MNNTAVDTYHVKKHNDKECKTKNGRFHPQNPKFKEFEEMNDQVVEQSWSIWGPGLKSIMRKSTEYRANWYLYVFYNSRNEYLEHKMVAWKAWILIQRTFERKE